MTLPVLAAMVVIGVAGIVLAVHLTGGSRPARLSGEMHALQRFGEDFPEERIQCVVLTQDGATAFLLLDRGRTGIVHGFGDRFLTRVIGSGDVAAMEGDEHGLRLRLRDFTWKGGMFQFADAAAAARVRTALGDETAVGAG